jgi:PilZ domain
VKGRRRTPDRRRYSRFEVVGDLSGMLEVVCPLPVVDVSTGGALLESNLELKIGSVHWVVMANGIEVGHAQICVKHVRPAANVERGFLIGVEFLTLSPALTQEIVRWVSAGGTGAAPEWSAQ